MYARVFLYTLSNAPPLPTPKKTKGCPRIEWAGTVPITIDTPAGPKTFPAREYDLGASVPSPIGGVSLSCRCTSAGWFPFCLFPPCCHCGP